MLPSLFCWRAASSVGGHIAAIDPGGSGQQRSVCVVISHIDSDVLSGVMCGVTAHDPDLDTSESEHGVLLTTVGTTGVSWDC